MENSTSAVQTADVEKTHGKNEKARLAVQASVAANAAKVAAKKAEAASNTPAVKTPKAAKKTAAVLAETVKVNVAALKALPAVVAFVMSEPITNYLALDVNGVVLPFRTNEVSTANRADLKGTVYGPTYTKDDLFVCTSANDTVSVARALAGIRGRWNTMRPSLKRDVAAWVAVPVKSDRTK